MAIDQAFLEELEAYIKDHQLLIVMSAEPIEELKEVLENSYSFLPLDEIKGYLNEKKEPTFQELLFQYIDRRGWKDSEVYKRAGMDRKHFSKIRSNPTYTISKQTALSLAIALELNVDETESLLNAAGYSLSSSNHSDLVIQFFIEKEQYNLSAINEVLHHFSLKPIGGV